MPNGIPHGYQFTLSQKSHKVTLAPTQLPYFLAYPCTIQSQEQSENKQKIVSRVQQNTDNKGS